MPKSGLTTSQLRRRRSRRLEAAERKHKQRVRERDGHRCRFPDCPCHIPGLFLEVSHKQHKGMGGDPTGERSQPGLMVLVCNWRHKESPIAIDKERLRWVELTPAGADGPIAWHIRPYNGSAWVELARELAPGVIDRTTLSDWQQACLAALRDELLGNALTAKPELSELLAKIPRPA